MRRREHVGVDERARGAQDDQILKGESIFAPRAARRLDEAGLDETLRIVLRGSRRTRSTSRTL